MYIKKSFINNCPNFKPNYLNDTLSHNSKPVQHECSSCMYFSPKNCGFKSCLGDNINYQNMLV